MTGKMMIGLAAAAIVAAASATGASAQGRGNFPGKYTCGWMDSPIRLSSGRWVDGQVSRCGRDVYASERTCRGEVALPGYKNCGRAADSRQVVPWGLRAT
jgi:hypothetical protein